MQDLGLLQIHLTQMVIVMEWMMMIADNRPQVEKMLLQPGAAALCYKQQNDSSWFLLGRLFTHSLFM